MNVNATRLLTPPPEAQEIYPYRRVWRSASREGTLVIGMTGLVLVLAPFLQGTLSVSIIELIRYTLALLPAGLWILFSWLPENRAIEPRGQLLTIAVVSGLAANAVGVPIIRDFFQADRWLPQSSAILRIAGYSLTVGLVQETIKYLVIRGSAWPTRFRVRQDGVAYGMAAAIGYATMLNLVFIAGTPASLEGTALRVLSNYAYHIAGGTLIGYALAEVKLSNPNPLFLLTYFGLAITITGIAIPLRSGLISPPLLLTETQPRFALSWAFQIGLIVLPLLVLVFLIGIADRRQEESTTTMD